MELSPCKLGHDEAAVRAGASSRTPTPVDRTKQLAPARIKADSQVVHWVGTIKCSVATQAQTLDPTASASVGVAVSEGGFSCLCWCWGTTQSCVACIPSLLGNLVGIWSTTSLIEAAYAPNLKLEASSGSSLCRHPWTACSSLLCSYAPLASPRRSPALALMARAGKALSAVARNPLSPSTISQGLCRRRFFRVHHRRPARANCCSPRVSTVLSLKLCCWCCCCCCCRGSAF